MYTEKIITMEKALEMVPSDSHIVTGLGACEARNFMENIHKIADRVRNVTITNCLTMGDRACYDGQFSQSFNIDAWFYMPDLRNCVKNGNISFIPNHLHLCGKKRLAHINPNIYVGAASMPDRHGYVSLSLSKPYASRISGVISTPLICLRIMGPI